MALRQNTDKVNTEGTMFDDNNMWEYQPVICYQLDQLTLVVTISQTQ